MNKCRGMPSKVQWDRKHRIYPTEVHLGSENNVEFENGFENGSCMMEITVLPDRIRAWN